MYVIWNYFLLHGVWGFGLGFVCAFVFFRGKRYRPFRFGGDNPFSIGSKPRWIFWYGIAYGIEKVTSLLMGSGFYTEAAMSLVEAAAFTIGAFLADRIAMMFEPEELWMPKQKGRAVVVYLGSSRTPASGTLELTAAPPAIPEAVTPQPAPADPVSPPAAPRESWFRKHLRGATESMGAAPRGLFGKVKAAAAHSRSAVANAASTAAGVVSDAASSTASAVGRAASVPIQAAQEHVKEMHDTQARIAEAEAARRAKARGHSEDLLKDR